MVVAVTLPVAWWGLAATGGLRLGESLGLAWGDVDLSARTLRVRRALQRFDGKLRFVEPKSSPMAASCLGLRTVHCGYGTGRVENPLLRLKGQEIIMRLTSSFPGNS